MKTDNAGLIGAVLIGIYTLVQLGLVLLATQGHFVYALDDPYIHLDLARQLALTGIYGLNPGEYAAPSSSILWPLVLVPLAYTPGFVYAPFIIGLLAAAGCAAVITRLLPRHLSAQQKIILSVLATLALNLPAMALMGMEHGLHVLLSLLAALGVLKAYQRHRAPDWLWAIVILLPLIRYEGIFVSIAVLGCLFWRGQRWQSVLAGAALLVPLALFSLFINAHGLGYLPGSTIVKKLRFGALEDGFFVFWIKSIIVGLRSPSGIAFIAASLLASVLMLGRLRQWRTPRWALMAAISGTLVGHLVLGRLSAFETPRYEQYALAFAVPLALWLAGEHLWQRKTAIITSGFLLAFAAPSLWSSCYGTVLAAQAIYQQQYQMQRLVQQYWHDNVAVNDIGLVGLGTDAYVLDLVGLANTEVRLARTRNEPDWADRLVRAHNVPLIMIYRSWYKPELRSHWTALGELFRTTYSTLGDNSVLILTPQAERADDIRAILRDWAADLPEGTHYAEYGPNAPAPAD